MLRLRAILLSLAAVLMLMSSSYAIGYKSGADGCGSYLSSQEQDSTNLPTMATDLMCGKRMMPAAPEMKAFTPVEEPRATEAQWQRGLASDPIREGRGPWMELEPPRSA